MSIIVTCHACSADNRLEARHLVVRFCTAPGARAAELLFACTVCGSVPVQRVPKELAAVAVFRGAASMVVSSTDDDLIPPGPPGAPPPVLCLDDLLQLHLQLEDGDLVRSFFEDCAPDGR